MRRHELDPVSLTFGFAFTGIGLLFLLGQPEQALRLRWVWPLLLLALGVGILLDIARSNRRTDQDPELDLTRGDPARGDPARGESTLGDHPGTDPDPATGHLGPDPTDRGPDLESGRAVDNREHPI